MMARGPSKRIIVVDAPAILAAAEDTGRLRGAMLVAVSASGMAACEAAGLPYRRLDSWCSPEEIADLGWRNYRNLDNFCSIADDAVRAHVPELACRGLFPFGFSFYKA